MASDRAHELRQWAFGDDTRSAAIELLLHTHLADENHPWVVHDRAWDTWAVDFDALLEAINGFAAEHRAWKLTPSHLSVLSIVASIADNTPVQLGANLPDLEHGHAELVMIAIAHSAGYTSFTTTSTGDILESHPPLASWPDDTLRPDD